LTQLTDEEINRLIKEPKKLPVDFIKRLRPVKKAHRQHKQSELEVVGEERSRFKISIRKNDLDLLDFSVILIHYPPEGGVPTILLRYNGKHFHKNVLENEEIHGYHIHIATERYQMAGLDIDGYAELSTEYSSPTIALEKMIIHANFQREQDTKLNGFGD
jgi:hypothetical protein